MSPELRKYNSRVNETCLHVYGVSNFRNVTHILKFFSFFFNFQMPEVSSKGN